MQRPIFILTVLVVFVLALGLPYWSYAAAEKGPRCSDGLDNDGDGLVDSDDPDCGGGDDGGTPTGDRPRYDINMGWVDRDDCTLPLSDSGDRVGPVQDVGSIYFDTCPLPDGCWAECGQPTGVLPSDTSIISSRAAGPVEHVINDVSYFRGYFNGLDPVSDPERGDRCFPPNPVFTEDFSTGTGVFAITAETLDPDSLFGRTGMHGDDNDGAKEVTYRLELFGSELRKINADDGSEAPCDSFVDWGRIYVLYLLLESSRLQTSRRSRHSFSA